MTDNRLFGLISDTHGQLHPRIHLFFKGVEAILHAGDVGGQDIIAELETIAPVFPVQGNTDPIANILPPNRIETLPFGKVAIEHGHLLLESSLEARYEELFQKYHSDGVRLILTGHTHKAVEREKDGVLLINPGAACRPRFRDIPSVCLLNWQVDRDLLLPEFRTLDWNTR